MLKKLEKGITGLVRVHREHLEVWRSLEKELERLEASYKNHSEQRNLFIKVDLSRTELGSQFPATKDKLISKLDIKISDLDSRLRDKLEIMEDQKNLALRLSAECTKTAGEVEFGEMMSLKSVQLETGFLVEFCYDLEETYLSSLNLMKHFLSINSTADKGNVTPNKFLDITQFEKVLTDFYLL